MATSHDPAPHLWGEWLAYDEHSPARDEGWSYHRQCQYMGCYVRQRVEKLVPQGKLEEWDPKAEKSDGG